MSNEATVQSSVTLRLGNKVWVPQPTSFRADVAGVSGPTPGSLIVSPSGVDVSLAQLQNLGGLCRIMNVDTDLTNYLEAGIWDPVTKKFYPMLEFLAGESYIVRLSRWLGYEYGSGTGTGTHTATAGDRLRLRANARTIEGLVEANDK
jgi:hypothetical protein